MVLFATTRFPEKTPGVSRIVLRVVSVTTKARASEHGSMRPQLATFVPLGEAYAIEDSGTQTPVGTSQTSLTQSASVVHTRH